MEEQNEEKKGLHNLKKLLRWDKKDWWWVLFFFLLLLLVWGWRSDTKLCREFVQKPEFQKCYTQVVMEEARVTLQEKYPGAQVVCYEDTGQCMISGGSGTKDNYEQDDNLLDFIEISPVVGNESTKIT